MTKEQLAVSEFNEVVVGYEMPKSPEAVNWKIAKLRFDLIEEELGEFWDAASDAVSLGEEAPLVDRLTPVADALGDLLYVVLGAASHYGIDLEPVFWEIHRSNMSKKEGGHRREDGKWIKGPKYSPADLKPIIEAQMRKQLTAAPAAI